MALILLDCVPQELVHKNHNGMSFAGFSFPADQGTPRKSGVTDDANNDRLPAN